MNAIRLYGEFSKVQRQDDGTIVVSGIASSETVDSDGETILGSAIKAALPAYMKFPAVREMHQAIAAGTMLTATVADDGKTYVEAHVVDPIAVKKVLAGVYRGFSIGGRVAPGGRDTANPKVIKRLSLSEISLVDRPANPEATFQIVKLETNPEGEPLQPDLFDKGDAPGHPFRGNQHTDGSGGGGARDEDAFHGRTKEGSARRPYTNRDSADESGDEHATQNSSYGYYGALRDRERGEDRSEAASGERSDSADAAYRNARTAVADALVPGGDHAVARDFLDSNRGRHIADQVVHSGKSIHDETPIGQAK